MNMKCSSITGRQVRQGAWGSAGPKVLVTRASPHRSVASLSQTNQAQQSLNTQCTACVGAQPRSVVSLAPSLTLCNTYMCLLSTCLTSAHAMRMPSSRLLAPPCRQHIHMLPTAQETGEQALQAAATMQAQVGSA